MLACRKPCRRTIMLRSSKDLLDLAIDARADDTRDDTHDDTRADASAEPPFTVFVRSYATPEPDAVASPGRWEAHDRASLDAVAPLDLVLGDGVVEHAPARDVGVTAWNSCAGHLPWGQPEDQTPDDARSLTVEWALPPGTVVLGQPRVRTRVRLDDPRTHLSAKLCLVGPAGSLLVDRGLTVVEGAAGAWTDVDLELEATAFEVTEGVVLRLSLACADWPNTVAPQGTWSAADLERSMLVLPVSAGTPHPAPVLPRPVPDTAEPDDGTSHVLWRHGYDVLGRTRSAEVDHGSTYTSTFGGRRTAECVEHYVGRVEVDARTGRQLATASTRFEVTWPDLDPPVRVTSESRLSLTVAPDGTLDALVVLDVHEGPPDAVQEVATRRWHEVIPPVPPG
jgi:uncharacterized protein